jgi:membrane protease YdiL (CAAX protease family)
MTGADRVRLQAYAWRRPDGLPDAARATVRLGTQADDAAAAVRHGDDMTTNAESATATPPSTVTGPARRPAPVRDFARRHPAGAFLAIAIGLTWPVLFALLAAGKELDPGLLLELVVLLGGATLVTAWTGGRAGVRRLFAGAIRWRMGFGRFIVFVTAMPALTLAVAATTGTLHTPAGGWAALLVPYLISVFLVGVLVGNVWEETAWAGFLQSRLMARHGLLVGSLLTAVPFFVIHIPLAFSAHGWRGTTWGDAALDLALIALAAPFFRYLVGTQLIDTGGSVLAVGLLHAGFNASGQMAAIDGWEHVPAVIILTLAVIGYRRYRGRSFSQGYAPALADR